MASWYSLARSFTLLRLAIAEYRAATLQTDLGGSYSDCPCIDVERYPTTRSILDKYRRDDGTFVSAEGNEFPAGYGNAKCTAWDNPQLQGDPHCQESPPPRYCTDSWCFVDSNNCARNHIESPGFPGLSVSYHTCGSVGLGVRSKLMLYNKTIRVFVPGGLYVDPHSKATSSVLRSMIRFALPVLAGAGVEVKNIVYQNLSRPALEKAKMHEYAACARDTVLGNVDLCVGDFWDTSGRRDFGALAPPAIFQENFFLYGRVPETKTKTFLEIVAVPFKPFKWTTWLMLVGATIFASCALSCFEKFGGGAGDEEGAGPSWLQSEGLPQSAMHSLYFGLSSFASGAPTEFVSATLSAKVVMVGFSIFITIVNASFTANLASLLVAKATPDDTVTSFRTALKRHAPVCIPASLLEVDGLLDEKYGNNWQQGMKIVNKTSDCFELVRSRKMRYLLTSDFALLEAQITGEVCDLDLEVLGEEPVVSMPTGFIASKSVYQAISLSVTRQKVLGTWEKIKKRVFFGRQKCQEKDSADEDENQLTPENMAGTVFILFIFCACGVMVRVVQVGLRSIAKGSSYTGLASD